MPSWFKKVFKSGVAEAPPEIDDELDELEDDENRPKVRNLISAPIIVPEGDRTGWTDEIKIKAKVEADGANCVFMVDRPVLDGHSAWFPERIWAKDVCSIGERLFAIEGVRTVLLHDMTVTIGYEGETLSDWEDLAKEIGAAIREQLKSEEPVIIPEFFDNIPPEQEIREKLQTCLDLELNPGISTHSGVITLERVDKNTVYISMGGGCQGCAASTITLRSGIHTVFRKAVPEVGAIYDETDHSAGTNPFFKELPAGMA